MLIDTDRKLGMLAVVSCLALVLMVGMQAIAFAEGRAGQRTDELRACQSIARTEIDLADDRVDAALVVLLSAVATAQDAYLRNDPRRLAVAIEESAVALALARDAGEQAEMASAEFLRRITMSREDEDRFLRDCRDF